MNRIEILILMLLIFTFSGLYSEEAVGRTNFGESIIIINTNVTVYRNSKKGSSIIKMVNFLDIFKIKGSKIINGRIEIYIENGRSGWVNVSETSYIKNLGWKKFDKIEGLELYLPKEYKYNFKVSNLPENESGRSTQYDFVNPNLYIKIYYCEERKEFNITNLYFEDTITEDTFKKMLIHQTEAYYGEYKDPIEGSYVLDLFLIKDDRKKSFSISIIFPYFTLPVNYEKIILARKILFSSRVLHGIQ
ncbi:MAG: hypothetical protein ACP5Q5_02295 [Brevinematia bacterium]